MPDQRKDSRRVPFSEEDGVLCVVIKPDPSGGSFYLQALDVSENGIKFKTATDTDHPCSIWETLYLSEIVGTRSVKFAEPIELVVKWQENEVDQCVFGCQIHRSSPESKKRYVNFVRSEMAFGGIRNLSPERSLSGGIDPKKEEDEMAALEERMRSRTTAEQPRTRLLAFAGLLAVLAILLASAFYTCSQNRDLAKRLDQMENRLRAVPAPEMSLDQVQGQLDSIEQSLAGLQQLAQENQGETRSLEGKLQVLAEKVKQVEARPVPSPRDAAKEKAEPAPPKKTTTGEQSSGTFHVVEKGENLFRISVKYNVPLDRLAEVNGMKVNDPIYPGQKIKLP